MSKKSGKIADLIQSCEGQSLPAHYLGYFKCFNEGMFYEAHDVLEELWLKDRQGPHYGFYKGLIQFAGAFVHLQKDRLRPAVALFRLSQSYLGKYGPLHEQLNVSKVMTLADQWVEWIEKGGFKRNPLAEERPPCLPLEE